MKAENRRYHISKDGKTVTDRKNNTTFSVSTFSVVQKGKMPSVLFNDGIEGKKQEKLARHTIDESDFSFGPASPAKVPFAPSGASCPPPIGKDDRISFTKEELLDLHQAHLDAANLTLRKLASYIKQNG